jgi:hypothetical protein
VREQISFPYKTTGKIVVLYILMFKFLERRSRRRWEDNIKMDLREMGSMGRTGFSWLIIGSSGGLL